MNKDNTFHLSESTGWTINPSLVEVRISTLKNKTKRFVDVYDVYRDDETEIVTNHPEYGQDLYVHENHVIELKHACLFTRDIVLRVHYRSYTTKGKRRRRCVDAIPFRHENTFYTGHFKESIEQAMTGYGITLKHCAEIFNTTPAIVKEINKARLKDLAGDMKPTRYCRHLSVDEFLLHKGHRYCTIVIDADSGQLLFMEPGKKAEQLEHFFRWVGDDFMRHVEAISMDMNTNYSSAVKRVYPHVRIVYDLFHIIKLYNDSVITKVRNSVAGRLQRDALAEDKKGNHELADELRRVRTDLFNGRMLLLANEATLKARDARNKELNKETLKRAAEAGINKSEVHLRNEEGLSQRQNILKANETIQNVCRMRECLQDVLKLRDPDEMEQAFIGWIEEAKSLKISQLTRFANSMKKRLDGIVSKAKFNIASGKMEGVNGFIKSLRRSAFGYQDFDYFVYLIWEQCEFSRQRYEDRQRKNYYGQSYFRKEAKKRKPYIKRLEKTTFDWQKHPAADAPPIPKKA